MILAGIVTPNYEAVVSIVVETPVGEVKIDAVVDTGFTDCLTLPATLCRQLGLSQRETTVAQLADGSLVGISVFDAQCRWFGQSVPITVCGADGGPLLGMGLMRDCSLSMLIAPGGPVSIAPIAP